MIDLTKLSDKELNELKKQIANETKNRGCKIKCQSNVWGKLVEIGFDEKLSSQGITNEYDRSEVLSQLEKAIYKITDITIGNYKIKDSPKRTHYDDGKPIKSVFCNGASLQDEMYDDFCNMTSDITNVISKYFKKED